MIQNLWKNVRFYCLNHEKPIEMTVKEGNSPFYACPKYMLKDDKHPNGHEKDEYQCNNRISFTRAVTVMEKFMKIIEDDDSLWTVGDYTGMQFKYDGMTVKILKYDPEETKIGILNEKAMRS